MKIVTNCPNCHHEAVYELVGTRPHTPRGKKPAAAKIAPAARAAAVVGEWLAAGFAWEGHVTSAELYALFVRDHPGTTISQRAVGTACAGLGVEHRRIMGERRYFPYYSEQH